MDQPPSPTERPNFPGKEPDATALHRIAQALQNDSTVQPKILPFQTRETSGQGQLLDEWQENAVRFVR